MVADQGEGDPVSAMGQRAADDPAVLAALLEARGVAAAGAVVEPQPDPEVSAPGVAAREQARDLPIRVAAGAADRHMPRDQACKPACLACPTTGVNPAHDTRFGSSKTAVKP